MTKGSCLESLRSFSHPKTVVPGPVDNGCKANELVDWVIVAGISRITSINRRALQSAR